MPGVLAEVMCRVDHDPLLLDASLERASGKLAGMREHVCDHVRVARAERPGPRPQAPGVRADQAGARLRRDSGELAVPAAPAVVDQISSGSAGLAGDLVPPRVDTDHRVWVRRADRSNKARGARDLL